MLQGTYTPEDFSAWNPKKKNKNEVLVPMIFSCSKQVIFRFQPLIFQGARYFVDFCVLS